MKLEICLTTEEDIDVLPSKDMLKAIISEVSSFGAEKITITPVINKKGFIEYDIKYHFPSHITTTRFYTAKEHPEKFSDHFSRIH